MKLRLVSFLGLAFIPLLVLGILFPERITKGPATEERYHTTPGADIVAFVRDGCPHCAAFEAYTLKEGWKVEYHEITQTDAQELFSLLQKRAPGLQQGVPTIVIDGNIVQGYESNEKTGAELKARVERCHASQSGCLPFTDLLSSKRRAHVTSAAEGMCDAHCETDLDKYVWELPVLGRVDLTRLSLPMLSILLGFLDGFNPCAMWMLLTLLTLLINTQDMRKVWVIGGTFLFVSGAIYYLFIATWLNVFLLIGLNVWVQKLIGICAVGGGGFYLYEALARDPTVCRITDHRRRQRTIERMKMVMQKTAWPAMVAGVAVLAASVNMIELVCTAGLPAIFTQILAFNDLSHAARYSYIALYILLYMSDDLIIFTVAVYTLHATGLTTKYRRLTLIVGGFLMYALGLLLIFAPEALTFG